jgi:hypothetical protein
LAKFSSRQSSLIFPIIFIIFYWQRKRLQDFFQKIKNPSMAGAFFILIGWVWALFLELTAGLSPFHPAPLANYLIGLGFYLPYFSIWLILINRFRFSVLEVFFLSGSSKVLFDILITRKLFKVFSLASSPISALLVFIAQVILTLVLFGMLTALPALFLKAQDDQEHNKSLKQYLLGLTPNFLTTLVLVIWMIVLKMTIGR